MPIPWSICGDKDSVGLCPWAHFNSNGARQIASFSYVLMMLERGRAPSPDGPSLGGDELEVEDGSTKIR